MQCPECGSTHIRKNGLRRGKKNHICVDCSRQFIDRYDPPKGYSDEVKQECLKMLVNGMGFRGIERVKGVHHTTVIYWLKQVGQNLPDAYAPETIPQVGELDGHPYIHRWGTSHRGGISIGPREALFLVKTHPQSCPQNSSP